MNTASYEVVEHDARDVEHVTLETKPATVTPIRKGQDLEWLMHDVCSTPYAVIAREVQA